MKVAVLCHSDCRGGAAVVSRRLTHALADAGVDAAMVVGRKETADPLVAQAFGSASRNLAFAREHLAIAAANGLTRRDLFKVSTGLHGMDIDRHPLVREADAVIVNWINQGFCTLGAIGRMAAAGKKVVWTMHDMWNATALCHHSGDCRRYLAGDCMGCPLMQGHGDALTSRAWRAKKALYGAADITFVAVSRWLADVCRQSPLMETCRIEVIPNALPLGDFYTGPKHSRAETGLEGTAPVVLMCAARLDDPIKGLDKAVEALNSLKTDVLAVFVGGIRDSRALDGLTVPHVSLGPVTDAARMAEIYAHTDVVISSSCCETLPTTLIEGLAAGADAVSFDRGGQGDIIIDGVNGALASTGDAEALARAIDARLAARAAAVAAGGTAQLRAARRATAERFAPSAIASAYLSLLS
ncbi:MAG: glycosyltransferase [Muribaculaceae bacterium]|nr:glycosyltransferase [Muribaculaceae bacterium]